MKKIAFIFLVIMYSWAYLIGDAVIAHLANGVPNEMLLKSVLWIVHIILISTVILAPFVARINLIKTETPLYRFLQWTAYHLMGFYFILMTLLLIKWPISYFFNQTHFQLFATIAIIIFSVVATFLGYKSATKSPHLINVDIKIDKKYNALSNLKIIQISDVHVSSTIKREFVLKIVEMANRESPDLIMLTGDFIDGHVDKLKDELLGFKNLKAKYGVYYVPGNHEYYWDLENWLAVFKELNFKILLNTSEKIKINDQWVCIGGVHDLASHRISKNYKCDPDAAFLNVNDDYYKILLAHQPKTIHRLKKESVHLVLSGHTHAGQFFPANILIFLFQPYVKGLHKIKNTWLYINQGTGYWGPPNRLGTTSEITLLKLHS